jgi:biopolymer transport protein ExbD
MLHPHKSPPKIATIDWNAITFTMLGIVFTLLMAFMIATPMHHCCGPHLPRVAHPVRLRDLDRGDVLLVSVAHDGMIFLGSDQMNQTDLVQNLRLRLDQGAERKLYIQADDRARYKSMSVVLDAAGSAGIDQVAFLADQLKNIKY